MKRTVTTTDPNLAAIQSLLDRLDPGIGTCDVPGCVHHHRAGDHHDATWVGAALAA